MNDALEAIDLREKTFDLERFKFSPVQVLSGDETFTMEEWSRLGDFIRLTNQACQWWWGDWMNMGEDTFGEESSQALEASRWDEETLRVYAWVCRKVPPVNRLTGVPFTHYMDLAKLPVDEQHQWAQRVVDEQMSRRQLRGALRNASDSVSQPCVLIRCDSEEQAEIVEASLESVKEVNGVVVERTTRKRRA